MTAAVRSPADPADDLDGSGAPPGLSVDDLPDEIDRSLLFTLVDDYGPQGWDIYRGEVQLASRY